MGWHSPSPFTYNYDEHRPNPYSYIIINPFTKGLLTSVPITQCNMSGLGKKIASHAKGQSKREKKNSGEEKLVSEPDSERTVTLGI